MATTGPGNVIGNLDLDTPLWRIYPHDRFLNLLAGQGDALVNPKKWEDPFEDFLMRSTKVKDKQSGELINMTSLAEDWYGQCWCKIEETDAMWRIYSPLGGQRGVKVRSSARKIFDNLQAIGSRAPYLQFYIGPVEYLEESKIEAGVRAIKFQDLAAGGMSEQFAKFLLIKRNAFQHEAEVRLLFNDIDPRRAKDGILTISLDHQSVFDEVVLDPRLQPIEYRAMEAGLRAVGCQIPISQSTLYRTPNFEIDLD